MRNTNIAFDLPTGNKKPAHKYADLFKIPIMEADTYILYSAHRPRLPISGLRSN